MRPACTHLFYHQETVEELCAINSWASFRPFIAAHDHVMILDIGDTLRVTLDIPSACTSFEVIHDPAPSPEMRSYTYGLNRYFPMANTEWVSLWRSDYIYHRRYGASLEDGLMSASCNAVLPYEAFIGAEYADAAWVSTKLEQIIRAEETDLLQNAHVCPVHEMSDYPHFAMKKELWQSVGGMHPGLWGYGHQFTEFFHRLRRHHGYNPVIQFDMIAFHQTHRGTFGLDRLRDDQRAELADSHEKLLSVFGSEEQVRKFLVERMNAPLRPRWADSAYHPRLRTSSRVKRTVQAAWSWFTCGRVI